MSPYGGVVLIPRHPKGSSIDPSRLTVTSIHYTLALIRSTTRAGLSNLYRRRRTGLYLRPAGSTHGYAAAPASTSAPKWNLLYNPVMASKESFATARISSSLALISRISLSFHKRNASSSTHIVITPFLRVPKSVIQYLPAFGKFVKFRTIIPTTRRNPSVHPPNIDIIRKIW